MFKFAQIEKFCIFAKTNKNKNTMKNLTIEDVARLICLYNGQKATEKQILKCIKSFMNNKDMMMQFCKGRIN